MKLRLLLALAGLVSAPSALANWYEIEMLVFSRQPDASLKESFKAPEKALQPGKALDLIAPLYQPRVADLIKAIPACNPAAEQTTGSAPTDAAAPAQPPATLPAGQLAALQQLLAPTPALTTEPEAAQPASPEQATADSSDTELTTADDATAELLSAEQFNPQSCQMEQWTQDGQLLSRPLSSAELALQLPAPTLIPAEVAGSGEQQGIPYLLSQDQFSLKNVASQIKQDASKQLLLHTAWRQPLTSNRQRSHWYAGQYFTPEEMLPSAETPALMQQVQQQLQALSQGQSAMQQWFSPWQLDSLLSFRAGRFILFDGSFYLRQANDALPAQVEVKQQARLTLGQLNYLDHPRLGVIIQIKRYDPASPTATN
ncbi:CsiV family protein [Rheinheimera marina]|uniref:CsiV family protein n=2 Tax=Rheinheimera TaxID=67575 RepID=A0ABV9JQR3_9GAMM